MHVWDEHQAMFSNTNAIGWQGPGSLSEPDVVQ